MLKLRLQGTREDIGWFSRFLQNHPKIEVIEMSDIYANKGTIKYYRMYAEIQKVEFKEDKTNE